MRVNWSFFFLGSGSGCRGACIGVYGFFFLEASGATSRTAHLEVFGGLSAANLIGVRATSELVTDFC
jgi:hypothetical protein